MRHSPAVHPQPPTSLASRTISTIASNNPGDPLNLGILAVPPLLQATQDVLNGLWKLGLLTVAVTAPPHSVQATVELAHQACGIDQTPQQSN